MGRVTRVKYRTEMDAQIVGNEVLEHESNYISQRDEDMHQKDIIGLFGNIWNISSGTTGTR